MPLGLKPLKYGVPNNRVCWLVCESIYDRHCPEYAQIEYVFSALVGEGRSRRQEVRIATCNRWWAEMLNREMYVLAHSPMYKGELLHFSTRWVTPDGQVVRKLPLEPIHYVQENI